MPDLIWLADLGRASVGALWLPVAAWSAVALVVEAALRASRPGAALALPDELDAALKKIQAKSAAH